MIVLEQGDACRCAGGFEFFPIDLSLDRACDLEHRLPFGSAVRVEGHLLEAVHFLRFVVFAFDEELVSRGIAGTIAAVEISRNIYAAVQIDFVVCCLTSAIAAIYTVADCRAGQVYLIFVGSSDSFTAGNIAGYTDFADAYRVFICRLIWRKAAFDKTIYISLNNYGVFIRPAAIFCICIAAVDLDTAVHQICLLCDRKLVFCAVACRIALRPAAVDVLIGTGNAVVERYDVIRGRAAIRRAAAPGGSSVGRDGARTFGHVVRMFTIHRHIRSKDRRRRGEEGAAFEREGCEDRQRLTRGFFVQHEFPLPFRAFDL